MGKEASKLPKDKQSEGEQMEKLKQGKTFLMEKIEVLEKANHDLEATKRRLYSENEKQKKEILGLKSDFKKMESIVEEI